MNTNAANALLKNLEEPPAGTLFLVVSHSPGRLLPTIRSRCRTLRFQPLSDTEVAIVLQTARPELPASEIIALVAVAEGAPGRALQLAEAGVEGLTRDMDALAIARGGGGHRPRARPGADARGQDCGGALLGVPRPRPRLYRPPPPPPDPARAGLAPCCCGSAPTTSPRGPCRSRWSRRRWRSNWQRSLRGWRTSRTRIRPLP